MRGSFSLFFYKYVSNKAIKPRNKEEIITIIKRKKKIRKKECKIENVNNFSLRLKIEMIIFIISHQMYYTDFYYISSTGDIEHKVN